MILNELFKSIHIKILEQCSSDLKIKYLRKQGMKIGRNCLFETMSFSTEPYLIEIGDHVTIAYGTDFITHDGGIWCFLDILPDGDVFGKIKVGNNVFIGLNCTILPHTTIGNNCLIGAGSVVRGKFPDDSVIVGNPAKIITKMNVQKFLYMQNPGLLKTNYMSALKKKPIVKKSFGIE